MFLDLKKVFSNEGESTSFDYKMDLSSTDINGLTPFVSPVSVQGTVKNHNGFAEFEAQVSFDFSIPCDRCTRQINK